MNQHYNCGGQLTDTETPGAYVCESCSAEVRASVVERQESFERVAQRDSDLAAIAEAALEGAHD